APPGRAPAEAPATGRLPLFGGGMRVERPKAEAATTFTPVSLAAARAAKIRALPFERKQYETVRDLARLKAWLERALDGCVVAITTKTDTIDPMQATLCGFSLAVAPNEACYVPLTHRNRGGGEGLFDDGLAEHQIPEADALTALKP